MTKYDYWKIFPRRPRKATLGGLGRQPANFLDDRPIKGTGDYYYDNPRYVGLVCLEDILVQIDEMGIEHGYDVDKILGWANNWKKPWEQD